LFPLFLSLSFVSLKVWANLSHIGKKKTEKKKKKEKRKREGNNVVWRATW
jgi:hypothetical protein